MEIPVLIVEDNSDSREMLKIGIDTYNKSPLNAVKLTLFGEAETAEQAEVLLAKVGAEDIKLVFLDISLGGEKSGIDLIRSYPHLAYFIVSKEMNVMERIINSLAKPDIPFFIHKVSEAAFKIEDVVVGIRKFLNERNLFTEVLKIGESKIVLKKTALISKMPLRIDADGDNKVLRECTICDYSQDSHFFCSNKVDASLKHPHCLYKIDKRTTKSDFALGNIIQVNNMDPTRFVRISSSIIINLDYKQFFDEVHKLVYMSFQDSDSSFHAAIPYKTSFVTEDIAEIIRQK